MTPSRRKLTLTAHVACSVGVLGSIGAFFALAVVALTAENEPTIRGAYLSMNLTAQLVIVPLALASIATGLVQSLGTAWGLFKHYWVTAKLVLTVFATSVLLGKMEQIDDAAQLAVGATLPNRTLDALGIELTVHAAGGLLILLIPTVLSVYKPWGLTRYGRRALEIEQAPSRRANVLVPEGPRSRSKATAGTLRGEEITITLRRTYVFGAVLVIMALHLVLLHVSGTGLRSH